MSSQIANLYHVNIDGAIPRCVLKLISHLHDSLRRSQPLDKELLAKLEAKLESEPRFRIIWALLPIIVDGNAMKVYDRLLSIATDRTGQFSEAMRTNASKWVCEALLNVRNDLYWKSLRDREGKLRNIANNPDVPMAVRVHAYQILCNFLSHKGYYEGPLSEEERFLAVSAIANNQAVPGAARIYAHVWGLNWTIRSAQSVVDQLTELTAIANSLEVPEAARLETYNLFARYFQINYFRAPPPPEEEDIFKTLHAIANDSTMPEAVCINAYNLCLTASCDGYLGQCSRPVGERFIELRAIADGSKEAPAAVRIKACEMLFRVLYEGDGRLGQFSRPEGERHAELTTIANKHDTLKPARLYFRKLLLDSFMMDIDSQGRDEQARIYGSAISQFLQYLLLDPVTYEFQALPYTLSCVWRGGDAYQWDHIVEILQEIIKILQVPAEQLTGDGQPGGNEEKSEEKEERKEEKK